MRFYSWGKCSMNLQTCKARVALGAVLLAGLLPLAAVADIYNPFDGGGPQGNLVLTAGNTVAFNTSSSALSMTVNSVLTATASYESGAAVFRFNNVSLPSGVSITVTGTQPLVILSANDMTIGTTFNVSGNSATGGFIPRRAGGGFGGVGGVATQAGWPGSLGFNQLIGQSLGGAVATAATAPFYFTSASDLSINAGSAGGGGGGGLVSGTGGRGANGGGAIVLGARGLLRYTGTTDISAGTVGAAGATAGAGAKGNPGMLKLMSSVILANTGRVTAANAESANPFYNGRVTMISNMATPATYQPTKTGTDPLVALAYGYTTHNPVLTSTTPFDTATTHPFLGELTVGAATRGVLSATYWNQSLVTHPNNFRVEMVRLTGANSPFTGYDQVFIKNNTGGQLNGIRLKVGTNAAVLLPGTGSPGQLGTGQVFTTTVATGVAATIDELISYDLLQDATSSAGVATFQITNAVGGGVIDYQWQLNDGTGWVDLPGETASTLTVSNVVASMEGWLYRCELTDNTHAIFTNAGTLRLELLVSGITPSVTNLRQNESSQFQVLPFGGTPPYNYAWFRDSVPLVDGGSITGSSSDTLVLSGVALTDAGVYECLVTDSAVVPDTVPATSAVLNVFPALQATLTANAFQGAVGESASIGVVATGGVPPLTYQWRRDRGLGFVSLFEQDPFSGTNATTLTVDPLVIQHDLNLFRVVVTDAGSDVSGPASVTAGDATLYIGSPLSIVTHPTGRTMYNNAPSFSISTVYAGGVGTITYTWYRRDLSDNSVTTVGSGTASGAVLSLVINPANPGVGSYEYFCDVQDPTSTAQSNPARMDIGVPIVITLTTQDIVSDGLGGYTLAKAQGDVIVFSADVTGGLGALSYQWLKEDGTKALVPIIDTGGITGSSSTLMTLNDSNPNDNGTYYLAVSDEVGETLSAPTTLDVEPGLPVGGLGGLAALAAVLAGLGATGMRRRK
jgi:hypothetical protein